MEKLFSLKFTFLALVLASVVVLLMTEVTEARAPFRCPRMINCSQVCQGFPSCCVDGHCICEPCQSVSPSSLSDQLAEILIQETCETVVDCSWECMDGPGICVDGLCKCPEPPLPQATKP